MTTDSKSIFEGWAVLELMGHRRLGGYLREVEMGGGKMLRIDIPRPGADKAPLFEAAKKDENLFGDAKP